VQVDQRPNPDFAGESLSGSIDLSCPMIALAEPQALEASRGATGAKRWRGLGRLLSFFVFQGIVLISLQAVITAGLWRIKTSAFGASNRIMSGTVNADVVVTGSSRAMLQYDPRAIEAATGLSAFNLGRNGSQTDMQVAFFKAYLNHNRRPKIVIHNLDAFSFVTSREIFDAAQYMPYLSDPAIYAASEKINSKTWRSRYIPLYGYVVEDMNFTWLRGLAGFFGWTPREDFFLGFNPRHTIWTGDFEKYREDHPQGVRFAIEPEGVRDMEDLAQTCKENGIQLIYVYAPEYSEMQELTANRAEIFAQFDRLSDRFGIPIWDFSGWKHNSDKSYFYNSQHLNARGAEAFSSDLAVRLKEYLAAHPDGRTR